MTAKEWMLEKLNVMVVSDEVLVGVSNREFVLPKAMEWAKRVISVLPDWVGHPCRIVPSCGSVEVAFVVGATYCELCICGSTVYIRASHSTHSDTLPAWVLAALDGMGTYDAR